MIYFGNRLLQTAPVINDDTAEGLNLGSLALYFSAFVLCCLISTCSIVLIAFCCEQCQISNFKNSQKPKKKKEKKENIRKDNSNIEASNVIYRDKRQAQPKGVLVNRE